MLKFNLGSLQTKYVTKSLVIKILKQEKNRIIHSVFCKELFEYLRNHLTWEAMVQRTRRNKEIIKEVT